MEKSLLVEFLGESPLTKVLDFLMENSIFDYTKTEIAEGAGISRTSLYRIWEQLESYDIVQVSRTIGNTKLYRLNESSPIVKELRALEKKLILHGAQREEVAATG